jgi:hypothetical protein
MKACEKESGLPTAPPFRGIPIHDKTAWQQKMVAIDIETSWRVSDALKLGNGQAILFRSLI